MPKAWRRFFPRPRRSQGFRIARVMSDKTQIPALPELRELVKEYDKRVYSFISYLVFDGEAAEAAVLSSFSDFGRFYRRVVGNRRAQYDAEHLKLRLFQFAWKNAQGFAEPPTPLNTGRDMRLLNEASTDILARNVE